MRKEIGTCGKCVNRTTCNWVSILKDSPLKLFVEKETVGDVDEFLDMAFGCIYWEAK